MSAHRLIQPYFRHCMRVILNRVAESLLLPVLILASTSIVAHPPTQPIADSTLVFQEVDGVVAAEAEHFVSPEKRDVCAWYRIEEDEFPDLKPDPDAPHLVGSSGACYLEALPDSRATHDDTLKIGENFFPEPGSARELIYQVHITNPGRYYVWVRHLSTGPEDNGLHVGLNGERPKSRQRWQTIIKRRWAWESRQRTEEAHDGVPFALYLDIPNAGEHRIHFAMREDGLEMDKFVLARDRGFRPHGHGPASVVKSGTAPAPKMLSPNSRQEDMPDAKPQPLVRLPAETVRLPAPSFEIADTGFYVDQKAWHQVCTDGVQRFGPFKSLGAFYNCRTDQRDAINDLRDAINASSASDPAKRKFVHVVSHHPANDNAGDFFTWQRVLDFGVTEHQIGDQNVGLKTAITPWDWAKSHADTNMHWIHQQLAYAEQDGVVKFQTNKFDCSDAGMAYWWITGADKGGNRHAEPTHIKSVFLQEERKLGETLATINDRFEKVEVELLEWPAELQKRLGKLKNIAFLAKPTKMPAGKIPLIISLHGAGGKEMSIADQLERSARVKGLRLAELVGKNLILLEPNSADNWEADSLNEMLDYLLKTHPEIDDKRVYVMGHSMGGSGTWDWINESPQRFAAAAPAGFSPGDTGDPAHLVKLPIWGMVGGEDGARVTGIRKMVEALRAAGNPHVKHTEFPGANHTRGNAAVFSSIDLVDWMLGYSR